MNKNRYGIYNPKTNKWVSTLCANVFWTKHPEKAWTDTKQFCESVINSHCVTPYGKVIYEFPCLTKNGCVVRKIA